MVRIPPHAIRADRKLRVRPLSDAEPPAWLDELASPGEQPVAISFRGQLRRSAHLLFDISDAARSERFFVLTKHGDGRWHVVRSRRVGDHLVVRTRRFSDWWDMSFHPVDTARHARHRAATALGLRHDNPGCSTPSDLKVTIEPHGTDAVWPCVSHDGRGLKLRLVSNRSVALGVSLPDGWRVSSKQGSSLGEDAWSAISDALRSHGLQADDPLLPAGGEMTLKSSSSAPVKFTLSANNVGLTFDTLLEGFAAAYKGAKGVKASAAQVAELAVCAKANWNGGVARDIAAAVDVFADCGSFVFKTGSKAFFSAVFTGVAKAAAGTLETLADVFGGSSSATILIGDYVEPGQVPVMPPPVEEVDLPACRDWRLMDEQEGDDALQTMADAHHDTSSLSTLRLSVGVYCKLYPGRLIDGVYSPSSRSPETDGGDGPIPTCAEWQQMDDAAADAALLRAARLHGDSDPSLSTMRLSAGAFCSLYPGRQVDGIYGG